ncbi:glycosyltransferase family 25 protein [Aeromonas hydrophila]|uniref:glycosyltransferase family 25 protein n=1 Tax=Aeromonas hydrophila TaxID=644 RepID=UPI0030197BB6
MRIYVVNMARSIERRQRISELLSEMGLEFHFFSAIDGRVAEVIGYDNERRIREKGHPLTTGEIGCFASHRSLWKTCVSLQENILILEDDIDLSGSFIDFLESADTLISKYKYIRLGRGPLKKQPMFGAYYCIEECNKSYSLVKYLRGPSCCHGYILSPVAAEKFLRHSEQWWWPVDDYMDSEYIHHVCDYGIEPPIVLQTNLPSEIGYADRENKGKRSLETRLRKEVYRLSSGLKNCLFNIKFIIKESFK